MVRLLFAAILLAPTIHSAAPQTPALDVCALMPKETLTALTGRKDFGNGRSSALPEGAMQCRYPGATGSITLVAAKSSKAKWDAFIADLKKNGAALEAAPGVGVAAFFWDAGRLYAHNGTHEVSISTSLGPGADQAKARANEIELAKALLAKLK